MSRVPYQCFSFSLPGGSGNVSYGFVTKRDEAVFMSDPHAATTLRDPRRGFAREWWFAALHHLFDGLC